MKRVICILIMALSLMSCEDKLVPQSNLNDSDDTRTENIYSISVDDALANLNAFMAATESPVTRSEARRVVGSIVPIKYNLMSTKASLDIMDCENILYVANFKERQGYAILAADTRIEEPVIAIIDEGYLSDSMVYSAMELANVERRGINDAMVGNFSLNDIEIVTSSFCLSYAVNQIRTAGLPTSSSDITAAVWTIKKSVSPILVQYVQWNQNSPFNDLYPNTKSLILFGSERKAYAGCFPLAIAKILTHLEYPGEYTYDGYTVDWKELKRSYTSDAGKLSAAHLLKGISDGCGSWYFYEGTFTFPSLASSYLRSLGLNNAYSYSYSFETITEMIDDGCPLIIYAIPGINITQSHSWNIDGYEILERTDTSTPQISNMVHCDFGWRGNGNGYYVSGVFKVNGTHYNNYLHLIAYDKPTVVR